MQLCFMTNTKAEIWEIFGVFGGGWGVFGGCLGVLNHNPHC